VKVQEVICGRLAVFLRVRNPKVDAETLVDATRPHFPCANGYHAENGNGHVPPVENTDVEGLKS